MYYSICFENTTAQRIKNTLYAQIFPASSIHFPTFHKTALLVYNKIMSIVGIIAEYNPFHNGHVYHLKAAKELSGADRAIVVMSGDFVQRGEPAMFDKHLRAKWALQNGADMVLLLPAVFSLASAQAFASGGVGVLHGTGIVDHIAFGSESGDTAALQRASKLADDESDELKQLIRANLNSGLSYPDARAKAWQKHMEEGTLLSSPNDILGIEYIRALNALGSNISPVAVPRTGPRHDSSELTDGFASASAIRSVLLSGAYPVGLVPDGVHNDILTQTAPGCGLRTPQNLSRETVYALRRMTKEQLSALPDVSEGLENLLYSACRQHGDIVSVLEQVKSRRYTMARLKRICMCALLGVYGSPMDKLDWLYIRVLGIRKDAMHLLSRMNEKASLPIVTRYADAEQLSHSQRNMLETDLLASDIASMASSIPSPARFDFSRPLIIV